MRELLGVDLSKQQQSSDWASDTLTEAQMQYAASDVLYLHACKEKLEGMLAREGRLDIAQACFGFLPHRAALDLAGWPKRISFHILERRAGCARRGFRPILPRGA